MTQQIITEESPMPETMPVAEAQGVIEPVSFRQALTAGVNRLATALDDLDATGGRKAQAAVAVGDAHAQVAVAQEQMQIVSGSVDDARAAAVGAFDILADTLSTGRASIINGG